MDTKEDSKRETDKHRLNVATLLSVVSLHLSARGTLHDLSKLSEPELSCFAEWGPKLGQLEYGTEEYEEARQKMGEALKHHYENNRHHPEHFEGGVGDMNLVDLFEMVCDWKAASLRMKDGSFEQSVETCAKRFNIDPQLAKIIMNTKDILDKAPLQ